MKFIDEATITVRSGDGGRGCVSFRREKFVPKGGPDGGDGGRGGDVIIKASPRKRTLYDFRYQRNLAAKNGGYGQGAQKTGKDGEDLLLELPPGTIIRNAETGEVITDLTQPEQRAVVAQGGRGGQGNRRFMTSTNRAPRFAQPGEPGQHLTLQLELKLLADVGLIGLPNVGKSTLISALSSARPKIGDYPFTTLTPNLGVVKHPWGEPFVVADIPGLIQGAHQGAGLGTQFLRHIERTRVLVHLIDAAAIDPEDPLEGYKTVNRELSLHDKKLAGKPQLVVLNKIDIPEAREKADRFAEAWAEERDDDFLQISARGAEGTEKLVSAVVQMLDKAAL